MNVVIKYCTHEEDQLNWVEEAVEQSPDITPGVETVLVSCDEAECDEA